ncbi:Regulator of chromosome condensation [Madurella fahalii]|uniref:Regulator of chromosome condensation n=1 Tax=Madurella fahalii TaxID=1157608 RepID=A0ABQ0G1I3_9PEZI
MAPTGKAAASAARKQRTGSKRTREDDGVATLAQKKRQTISRPEPPKPALTERPTEPLNIYAFGANSGGELGLGPSVKSGNVSRPRLNPYLSGSVGVVQVSLGAMHGAALTLDNRILTWGVNDHGALGRDTSWEAAMVDADDNNSDGEGDGEGELNPKESTPSAVNMSSLPADIIFTQVAAADNATFALTNTGLVYGWGTFRSNDGELAFSSTVAVQFQPALIPSLNGVMKICCGSNHVLALTVDGSVYTWGKGSEGQLGRRFSFRVADWKKDWLIPRKIPSLSNIVDIGTGPSHSFAIERTGAVYGWGFNNAGQIGVIDIDGEVESDFKSAVFIPTPGRIKSLQEFGRITRITGGKFHTIAATEDGKCLTWGRLFSFATGLKIDAIAKPSIVHHSSTRYEPSFLKLPTAVEGIVPLSIAAASEHSLAVAVDHQVYTWGLNLTKQLGQKGEEVEVAAPLRHDSISGKQIVWVGTGAQFSMVGEVAASSVGS